MKLNYVCVLFLGMLYTAGAGDWPMWRYDAGRSAITGEKLSYPLTMLWTRQLRTPQPAWPESQDTLQFDSSYEPVVIGKLIIIPSMVGDNVTAYETETGKEVWRFYSDGPVRFAPAGYNRKIYFGSDDGWLYCLDSNTGRCLWKFFVGPVRPVYDGKKYLMKEDERWILGNGRLISSWPVRGAPVVYDGKIYVAGGIFPFMGIFVHALDAETGRVIWSNTGNSMDWQLQPHDSEAFAGLVPQGYIAVNDSFVVIPGGRTTPGIYDRRSGKLYHLELANPPPGRRGDYAVIISGDKFFSGGTMFNLRDGSPLLYVRGDLYDRHFVYSVQDDRLVIQKIPSTILPSMFENLKEWMSVKLNRAPERIFLRAGNTFLGARADGTVMAIALDNTTGRIVWSGKVEGVPWSIVVGDSKVFVVTHEGKLYCFGERRSNAETLVSNKSGESNTASTESNFIKTILEIAKPGAGGYCLIAGDNSDALAKEFLQHSNMYVIVVNSDRTKIDFFRRLMDDADIYGIRTACLLRDPLTVKYPPYFADLICLTEKHMLTSIVPHENIRYLVQALKPYGGTLCVPAEKADVKFLQMLADKYGGSEYKVGWIDGIGWIKRTEKLPGAGWWTHQNADSCNTSMSEDRLVKAPFSVLWFGGPSNDRILPRHGHGPMPHVVNGRLIIEGRDMLRAIDVYTGRLLWEYDIPGIGAYYDRTYHHPGASETGGNYVSLPDAIYALAGGRCIVIEPATGKKVKEIVFCSSDGNAYKAGWLTAGGGVLSAVCSPFRVPSLDPGDVPPSGAEVLIPAGAIWEYYTGKPRDEDWKTFHGSIDGWSRGRAGFGYGVKVQTVLSHMRGKTDTLCLRKQFHVSDPASISQIIIMAKHDDDFTCYINGHEVAKVLGETKRRVELYPKTWPYLATYEEVGVSNVTSFLKRGDNIFAIQAINNHIQDPRFLIEPYVVAVSTTAGQTQTAVPFSPEHTALQTNVITSAEGVYLVVMDPRSGKFLWERKAELAFRHNTVVIGGGKLFCVDGLTSEKRQYLARRGLSEKSASTLYAFDLNTGKVLWQKKGEDTAFGTWLIYSEKYDALVVGGAGGRDRPFDEKSQGLAVYLGRDGSLLWKKPEFVYSGPCIVRDKMIITQPGFFPGTALDLLTGALLLREDPITGTTISWTISKRHGCDSAIGGWNILTFRSASAGFFDMLADYGTSNLGGVRSGCTPNVIPADGLLCLPDYTRTCTCLYQLQTSLAVVHDPDAEMWSFAEYSWNGLPVRRAGINFGAPGDRKSDEGTVWLDYPSVGGPSPDLPVKVEGSNIEYYRHHASFFTGKLPWVGCSGVTGAERIRVQVAVQKQEKHLYTVRLYFAEPELTVGAGDRIFEVEILGDGDKISMVDFLKSRNTASQRMLVDVVKEAGHPRVVIVREVKNVRCQSYLEIRLQPKKMRSIISGIEIIRQD